VAGGESSRRAPSAAAKTHRGDARGAACLALRVQKKRTKRADRLRLIPRNTAAAVTRASSASPARQLEGGRPYFITYRARHGGADDPAPRDREQKRATYRRCSPPTRSGARASAAGSGSNSRVRRPSRAQGRIRGDQRPQGMDEPRQFASWMIIPCAPAAIIKYDGCPTSSCRSKTPEESRSGRSSR